MAGFRFVVRCVAVLVLAAALPLGMWGQSAGPLQVFFVDVEGGQATLFVTQGGDSLLIDTGWPGNNGRDADRIVAAAKKAGIAKIDYVLLTHYHDDHVGGVPQLVARIPVGTFIDHGPNREMDHGITEHGYAEYQRVLALGKSKHLTAHAGDVLPIRGMNVKVISADGDTLKDPLPGSGETNRFCAASETRPADQTENARSLGTEITFGSLRILDLGDLTWDKEMQLMCPTNKLGRVDVLIVSHHGWNQSSSPALVDAIHPRVAIMDNGEKKGGSLGPLKVLSQAPGLETLWQLHYSPEGGAQFNSAAKYVANAVGTEEGHYLELTATRDGSFRVLNSRDAFSQEYKASR